MSSNPFSDPQMSRPGVSLPAGQKMRPGALTASCILVLVLGILGLLTGLCGVVTLPFAGQLQGSLLLKPGPDANPLEKAQYDYQIESIAIQRQYIVLNFTLTAVLVVLASLMTVGAIMALRWRPAGRGFLVYVLLAVIVFEMVRMAVTLVVSLETLPATDHFVATLQREAEGGGINTGSANALASFARGTMIFTIVAGVAWPFIKVILYGLIARYLASPKVRDLFEPDKAQPGSLPYA
jgi:hypothetical protein